MLSYTANRYRVIYYSHRIKPVPVAGREAHIHLCLVSVVRSSTSGPLVASDTDSSPAPSSQPSSLQFVAVGIRRPRRQSYFVFQYVKEPLSFHRGRSGIRTRGFLRFFAAYPRQFNSISAVIPVSPSTTQPSFRPCPVPCAFPQGIATSAASYRHILRCVYSPQSPVSHIPTWFLSSFR